MDPQVEFNDFNDFLFNCGVDVAVSVSDDASIIVTVSTCSGSKRVQLSNMLIVSTFASSNSMFLMIVRMDKSRSFISTIEHCSSSSLVLTSRDCVSSTDAAENKEELATVFWVGGSKSGITTFDSRFATGEMGVRERL